MGAVIPLQPVQPGYSLQYGYAQQYHLFYVDVAAGWKSDKLDIDARLAYKHTTIKDYRIVPPEALRASLKAVYTWGGRISAGCTLEGVSQRKVRMSDDLTYRVPGYVDLGLLADIQMTERLGFWLKSGNLLGQPVGHVPFHAEKGLWFTVGARFTL